MAGTGGQELMNYWWSKLHQHGHLATGLTAKTYTGSSIGFPANTRGQIMLWRNNPYDSESDILVFDVSGRGLIRCDLLRKKDMIYLKCFNIIKFIYGLTGYPYNLNILFNGKQRTAQCSITTCNVKSTLY